MHGDELCAWNNLGPDRPRLCRRRRLTACVRASGPILSVFPTLIVHSELKSVHPGFPVAFIF